MMMMMMMQMFEGHLFNVIFTCFWRAQSWETASGREGERQNNQTPSLSSPSQSHDHHRLFTTRNSRHVVLWVLPPGRPAAPRRETQARWWSKATTHTISNLPFLIHGIPSVPTTNQLVGLFVFCVSLCLVMTLVSNLVGSSSKQGEDWDTVLQVQI